MEKLRIPFPIGKDPRQGRPTADLIGYPDQAKPCDGHPCLIHDGECIWCGHLPDAVIAATWAQRERVVMAAA